MRTTHGMLYGAALGMGMGMVQSIVAAVLDIVPPLIPPPIWNNMPLPCAPMITGARLWMHLVCVCPCLPHPRGQGHNCFGAVLYPITMADFTIADVTDAMLDGAGSLHTHPTTYTLRAHVRLHRWLSQYLCGQSWQDERRLIQRLPMHL